MGFVWRFVLSYADIVQILACLVPVAIVEGFLYVQKVLWFRMFVVLFPRAGLSFYTVLSRSSGFTC